MNFFLFLLQASLAICSFVQSIDYDSDWPPQSGSTFAKKINRRIFHEPVSSAYGIVNPYSKNWIPTLNLLKSKSLLDNDIVTKEISGKCQWATLVYPINDGKSLYRVIWTKGVTRIHLLRDNVDQSNLFRIISNYSNLVLAEYEPRHGDQLILAYGCSSSGLFLNDQGRLKTSSRSDFAWMIMTFN